MKHIYFFVHRERFHLTIFNKNVTENIRMKIFIQTRVFAIKQKRCNLGSLLLFLKNATHEIQAHRLYCLILFNKPNSLHVFSNSFISQYDKMFSSKPHSM